MKSGYARNCSRAPCVHRVRVPSMMDDGSLPRLSANRLMAVDRALDELARTQRRSSIPVELPMPNFWDAVGQLVQHLEAELAETIRSEGMTAKAQLQSRKLGVVRTAVKDTRNRLNAFTQHAVLTNLIQSPEDVRASAGIMRIRLNGTSTTHPREYSTQELDILLTSTGMRFLGKLS